MHTFHEATGTALEDMVLRNMFAARKSVFIDLLKWDIPALAGQFEIDQFDTSDARYLIITDDAGAHLASARLLPTTKPHILSDLFPHLCAGPVPQGDTIMEITRFCLSRDLRAAQRRTARDHLVFALAHFALDQGVTSYTGVAELPWMRQIMDFGWRCRPLGIPMPGPNGLLGALKIDIDAQTPASLTHAGLRDATSLDPARLHAL